MDEVVGDRIDALEAEIRAMRSELAKLREHATAQEVSARSPEEAAGEAEHSLSRRRLLWSGGAMAAGAAGAVLASGSPASAAIEHPAADISFDTTGGTSISPGSNTVQLALAEVDLKKASLDGAGSLFTAPVTFNDAAQFRLRPWVDVRAFGAQGDGSNDDTGAIAFAIAVANSLNAGGTVLLPPGRYRFKGRIVVPSGVDLWGCGGHKQGTNYTGTVLEADNDTAQLIFETSLVGGLPSDNTGGLSGNFVLDGRKVNTYASEPTSPYKDKGLLYLNLCVERAFTSLLVVNSAGNGMVIDRSQNCTLTAVQIARSTDHGLVLDIGAGGNAFLRNEFTASSGDNVHVQESVGSVPSGKGWFNKPTNNYFLHCLMERGDFGTLRNNAGIGVSAGDLLRFDNCSISLGSSGAGPFTSDSGWLVLLTGGLTTFQNCYFTSSASKTGQPSVKVGAISNTNAGAEFLGINRFNFPSAATAIEWNGTAWGRVLGEFQYDNPGLTRWAGSGQFGNLAFRTSQMHLLNLEPNADFGLRTAIRGEAGFRFQVTRPGEIHVNDGTDFVSRSVWRMKSDTVGKGDTSNRGWETPQDVYINGGTLSLREVSGPSWTGLSVGDRAVIYVEGDNLVVAFKENGTTVRKKTLPLTGTTTTWGQSTQAV